jgi:hypothetical protein
MVCSSFDTEPQRLQVAPTTQHGVQNLASLTSRYERCPSGCWRAPLSRGPATSTAGPPTSAWVNHGIRALRVSCRPIDQFWQSDV